MPTIQKTLRILEFIKRYTQANGEAPLIKEIGAQFELTVSGAYVHLKKMEDKGWIKRSRRWRGIEIVSEEKKAA